MPSIKEFYYKETISSVTYTHTPSNTLAINELIAQKPCWVSPTQPHIEKQKSLVLADWTASEWSLEKIEQVKASLADLIDQGFSISIWQNGQLIPMDKLHLSVLDDENVRKRMTLESIETITRAAVIQNKRSPDKIHVIDDYWLKHLLSGKEDLEPRVLYTSELIDLTPNIVDKLIQVLNTSKVKLDKIIHDERSTKSDKNAQLLSGKFKKTPIVEDITSIIFDSATSTVTLKETLKAHPFLKKINLNACTALNETIDLDDISFDRLEHIDLSHTHISLETLYAILSKAPNLRAINLSGCTSFNGSQRFEGIHLPKLETINLNASNLSLEHIESICKGAPNLKHIDLSHKDNSAYALDIEKMNFSKIETIKLNHTFLPLDRLAVILKKTPTLKHLDLSGYKNLKDQLHIREINIKELETIQLSKTNISPRNLRLILKAAPKLKALDLSDCDSLIDEYFLFDNDQLLALEHIFITNSELSLEALQTILRVAPNLNQESRESIRARINELMHKIQATGDSLDTILEEFTKEDNSIPPINRAPRDPKNEADSPPPVPPKRPPIEHTHPKHDAQDKNNYTPPSSTKPFVFQGISGTKNQGMIIDKLCQFWTINHIHTDMISKIQKGICLSVSHYFSSLEQKKWDHFIELCSAWNGTDDISDELMVHFEKLQRIIRADYFTPSKPKTQYIGDGLHQVLRDKVPRILCNPWHAIAIKPLENGHWSLYDPNFNTGWAELAEEELIATIHHTNGTIFSIEAETALYPLAINNPDDFIREGGLLALSLCSNHEDILLQLPSGHSYSQVALEGLLRRGTSGRPAWCIGLMSQNASIQAFTHTLLCQFQIMNPTTWVEQLSHSLEAITPREKGELIKKIIEFSAKNHSVMPMQEKFIEFIRPPLNMSHLDIPDEDEIIKSNSTVKTQKSYETALMTWDKSPPKETTPKQYVYECLNQETSKRLIELNSTTEVDAFCFMLEQQATSVARPVFYIDKPEDLICSAPWMEKNADNTGQLCKGPGGPLYEFLKKNKDNHPLLIVNYEQFDADDIVRFNALLDKEPKADGTDLPKNTQIIGLMNRNKPDCYQGSDFYSRFNLTQHCPFREKEFDPIKSEHVFATDTKKSVETTIINLYHAVDWKERLLGQWNLDGDSLTFSEGALIKAIDAGKPIEIQNGLWDDPQFERFWKQAVTTGVLHDGRIVKIPPSSQIIRMQNQIYEWPVIPEIKPADLIDINTKVLNPSKLSYFFGRYEIDGNKLLKKPGLIELAKSDDNRLSVFVTRTLSNDAWAMLLDECNRIGVTLEVTCAKGVALPDAFKYPPEQPVFKRGIPDTKDALIITSDIDTTVSMINQKEDNLLVIDVSECTPSDLLVKLDGQLNKDTLHFEFTQANSALTTALAQNKKIILKGHFSPELIDALAPLLQERREHLTNGRIILVTDDKSTAQFMSNRYEHIVSTEEKMACLPGDKSITDKLQPYLAKEPLSKLLARFKYLKSNPSATNSDDAWAGMNSITSHLQTLTHNKSTSSAECTAFTEARLKKVNEVLKDSPYVFLTGLSGVGKTTFVENELCVDDALFLTESKIEEWACSPSDKRKILFIDEANLSPRQWSEFEGLFNKPPSILVNGTLYPLTENHRVIFAGNPVNYGDERTLAPFFKQHGNAVLFTPLPPAVIYEKILKPVFAGTKVDIDLVADSFLEVYRFVCECSTTDVLISPRELQMMALLTVNRAIQHPEQDIHAIAEQFRYDLAKNLVPETKREAFHDQFKPKHTPAHITPKIEKESEFLITPSRHEISTTLNDLLSLRQLRREPGIVLNAQQKEGGLGGIIIGGEPGIGKSELVITKLRALGYTEQHDFIASTTDANPFYRMPVSMPLEEKKHLLIKAFNEGAVVIIDEINSSPMMERLLNDLLMGKNPNRKEGDIVQPGFMVIGTQNPVTMAGRRAQSTALQRRLITTVLPEYESNEIKSILLAKGIQPDIANLMMEAYEKNRAYAIQNQLSPVPNFRHLMSVADNHLQALHSQLVLTTHATIKERYTAFKKSAQDIPESINHLIAAINEHLTHMNKPPYSDGCFGVTSHHKDAKIALSSVINRNDVHIDEVVSALLRYHEAFTDGSFMNHKYANALSEFIVSHFGANATIDTVEKSLTSIESMFDDFN